MAPKLYMYAQSPPVRSVLMLAKALDLELDLIQLTPTNKIELTKFNPQHTIPTLIEEDGFVLWDSHAIMAYLVSKHAKNDDLYPTDLRQRALVDQRLHFDCGVAFTRIVAIIRPYLQKIKKTIDQADIDSILELHGFVEAFLEGRQWIAGDSVTIADYSLISTITTIQCLIDVDAKKFPRITDWLKRAEQMPGYEANKKGLDAFQDFVKKL